MTPLSSPEIRSKFAASLARTAASVFICAMLDNFLFLCVSSPHQWRVFSGPLAGKVLCRLPVVFFVFGEVVNQRRRCCQPLLRPATLLAVAHHSHRAAAAGADRGQPG